MICDFRMKVVKFLVVIWTEAKLNAVAENLTMFYNDCIEDIKLWLEQVCFYTKFLSSFNSRVVVALHQNIVTLYVISLTSTLLPPLWFFVFLLLSSLFGLFHRWGANAVAVVYQLMYLRYLRCRLDLPLVQRVGSNNHQSGNTLESFCTLAILIITVTPAWYTAIQQILVALSHLPADSASVSLNLSSICPFR